MARRHIVLIPGFAGFDALGQLEYYAGVTPVFQGRGDAVLHYFDNLPTAAVDTRAERLQRYLAKRIVRGEVASDDTITLIGHSTGGLDIRCLVWKLHQAKDAIEIDGGASARPGAILDAIRRVVFLSVPHWGTNLADWVHGQKFWREVIVTKLRAAVAGSQVPLVHGAEDLFTGSIASVGNSGFFRALQDSLREADPWHAGRDPTRTAAAHEAVSQLELYLRHIATDFRAIDHLTAARPPGRAVSPAHFTKEDRHRERGLWEGHIEVRSYVTRAPSPFWFDPDGPAPVLELSDPSTWPEVAKDGVRSAGTDIVYRACYRACAGGPFEIPPDAPDTLAPWENDGIVNTASMYWSYGRHVTVECDHMDIVGHYAPAPAPSGEGRCFRAYDLLGSASEFDGARFTGVWSEIFDWAASR